VIDAREPAETIAGQIRARVDGLLTPRRPARLRLEHRRGPVSVQRQDAPR
jgi:hypothetical protein